MRYKKPRSQAGFTLIELTVVLLILIGLAGLLLPYVSGYMGKTHNSTTAKTIADLNHTIQRYQSSKWAIPNKLETLVDATAGTIYNKLQNTGMLGVMPTGAETNFANSSLAAAGLTSAYANDNATTDATFQSTTGSVLTLNGGTTPSTIKLAKLTGTTATDTFFSQLPANLLTADPVKNQLIYAFGGDATSWDTTCTNYVVMGIGSSNSMIPAVMQSAPVHFAGTGAQAPNLQYNRYLAVFAVPNGSATGNNDVTGASCAAGLGNAATFVGSAMIMPFPAIVGLHGAQQYANSNLLTN